MALPRIFGIPCWTIPFFSGFAWLVTLLSMIIIWVLRGSKHYPEMFSDQQLAYISNIGASDWGQPLFITGSAIMAISFLTSFAAERWLRHKGRLPHSDNVWAKTFSILAALLTLAATCSLFLLTIFDVRRHPYIHYSNVAVFGLGHIFAATLICAEKKLLSRRLSTNNTIRRSFYIKSFFVAAEVILIAVCTVAMYNHYYRTSVLVEWVAAFFFTFYISSFAIDFLAVVEQSEKSTTLLIYEDAWDEETGIPQPRKVHIFGHKQYMELP